MTRTRLPLLTRLGAPTAAALLLCLTSTAQAVVLEDGNSAVDLGGRDEGGFVDVITTQSPGGPNALAPLDGAGQSFYLSGSGTGLTQVSPGVFLPFAPTAFAGDSSDLGTYQRAQEQPTGNPGDSAGGITIVGAPVTTGTNQVAFNYTSGPLNIEATYLLDGSTPGLANLTETFTISWNANQPSGPGLSVFDNASFTFLVMMDPSLGPGASLNNGSFDGATNTYTQTGGGETFTAQASVNAGGTAVDARWELSGSASALRDKISDPGTAGVVDLADATSPLSSTDLGFAFEYSFSDFGPNSAPISVTVIKSFQTPVAQAPGVPEPASLALLAAGGLLLVAAGRRARRAG